MRRIWTVASRELRALFDLPTGYVLLVVFLAINGFLFFRQAYLSNTASLRPMLDLLPWEFLFFVPAVTMRSLAEDIRGGQIEVVLAQPISELELLLGKYLGSVLFLWVALLLTAAIPLGLAAGSDLAMGHRRRPVCRRRSPRGGARRRRRLGVEPDPQPDHGLHRGGRRDVRAGARRTRSIAGGPASRTGHHRRAHRGALPFRKPRPRRDRPPRRDLLLLAGRRLPGARLRCAARAQARAGRRGPPAAARRGDAGGLAGRGESARELHRRPARSHARQRVHALARDRPHGPRSRRHRDHQGVRLAGAADRGRADEAGRGRPAARPALRGSRPGAHHRARSIRGRGRTAGGRVARHPGGPVQRDRPGRAAGEAGLPRARGAARRADGSHSLRAADRRPRVPARLDDPAAQPRQEAGHRLRRRCAGPGGLLSGDAGPAPPVLRRARHRAE